MELPHSTPLPSNIEHVPETFMKNYSKTQLRMLPSTTSALAANDTVSFKLPAAKVVDLATLRFTMKVVTNGTATHMVGLPKYVSSLISQVEVICNGHQVCNIQRYNQIYNTIKDYSTDYSKLQQKLFNNADPSVQYYLEDDGEISKYSTYTSAGLVMINNFQQTYVLDDFIGFLDFSKGDRQSFFNTNLVGDFEIRFTFAPNSVLWKQEINPNGTAEAPLAEYFYGVGEIMGFIDAIEFRDSAFVDALDRKLSSIDPETGKKMVHLMPYKNYKSYTGTETINSAETTIRIVENTASLDKILFTYIPSDFNEISRLQLGDQDEILQSATATTAQIGDGLIPKKFFNYEYLKATKNPHLLNNSRYFRRTGVGLGYDPLRNRTANIQFEMDSQDLHQNMTIIDAYQETLKAFELDYNNIHKCNPGINNFSSWLKDFFLCAYSVSHVGGKTKGILISGLDTMATAVNIAVKVSNPVRVSDASNGGIPMLITEFTSLLMIGEGRTVAVRP